MPLVEKEAGRLQWSVYAVFLPSPTSGQELKEVIFTHQWSIYKSFQYKTQLEILCRLLSFQWLWHFLAFPTPHCSTYIPPECSAKTAWLWWCPLFLCSLPLHLSLLLHQTLNILTPTPSSPSSSATAYAHSTMSGVCYPVLCTGNFTPSLLILEEITPKYLYY